MNGLLDFIKTPEGQGLLTAAFGGLAGARRGAPLNSIGRAGLAGLTGYSNAIEAQNQQAQQAQMDELRKMQVEQYKAANEKSRAEAAEKARIDALLRGAVMPTTGADAIAQPGRVGPTPEKTGAIGQVPALDYQALLAQGVPFARVEELAKSRDLGRPQVKNIETVSIGGKPMRVGIDQYGQQVAQIGMQWTPLERVDAGGFVGLYDPTDPAKGVQKLTDKTMTPGEVASNQIARGQLGVAQGNLGVARERLNFERSGGADALKPQYRDGQWVVPPRDMKPGESRSAPTATSQTAVKEANEALALIKQAEEIIPKATGSYIGSAVDQVGRVFGKSTGGDIATGQLQAIEGALVAKMPKMSGPQSDKDVALYKQMAGVIGDPTIPAPRKMAALEVVKEIQQRYAGVTPLGQGQRPPADIQNLLNTYGGR